MAVQLQEVQKQFANYVDTQKVTDIEKKIDENLSNPEWTKNNCRGSENDRYWFMTIPGEVTEGEKKALAKCYLLAAWGGISINNSVERNMEPGMIGINIYEARQLGDKGLEKNFFHWPIKE